MVDFIAIDDLPSGHVVKRRTGGKSVFRAIDHVEFCILCRMLLFLSCHAVISHFCPAVDLVFAGCVCYCRNVCRFQRLGDASGIVACPSLHRHDSAVSERTPEDDAVHFRPVDLQFAVLLELAADPAETGNSVIHGWHTIFALYSHAGQ